MAIILDGKLTAQRKREKLKSTIKNLKSTHNINPKLAIIQGGDNPDSNQYVKNKIRACENIGLGVDLFKIPLESPMYANELKQTIINANLGYDGIILQLEVPGVSKEYQSELVNMINAEADVDSMTESSVGKFYSDKGAKYCPCTPKGILSLLDEYNIEISGKNVCVIGRSEIVGRPIAHLMMRRNATVTIAHSYTNKDSLYDYVSKADIVIVAVGKAEFINTWDFMDIDWSNKTIIDVGTNRVGNEWFGDVSQKVKDMCYAYSPVPGGVGPMTIVSLLEKVVDNAIHKKIYNLD